jgi:hypothetical protein
VCAAENPTPTPSELVLAELLTAVTPDMSVRMFAIVPTPLPTLTQNAASAPGHWAVLITVENRTTWEAACSLTHWQRGSPAVLLCAVTSLTTTDAFTTGIGPPPLSFPIASIKPG